MNKRIFGSIVIMLLMTTATLPLVSSLNISKSEKAILIPEIDQVQDIQTGEISFYSGLYYAQSFIPSKPKLTDVYLFLQAPHDYSTVTVFVSSQLDTTPTITKASVFANDINPENEWTWVKFDIPEASVIPGNTYYIIVTSDDDDDVQYVRWGYAEEDPYDLGQAYDYSSYSDSWEPMGESDFCFMTFGDDKAKVKNNIFEKYPIINQFLYWLLERFNFISI